MYYKKLFLLVFLLSLGCTLTPKTEVGETPRSERVIFYSSGGEENEIGCVNIQKLMSESLAAKEAENILKGFIAEGSDTLNQLKNEINVLEVLTKLQNKIEEIEDTSKEASEGKTMEQIKEKYIKFYQQFSLDSQALNYDFLKERREEITSIINRLGRKGKFKKIIDSSYRNTSGCQIDMTEEFMQIYDKMVENNYRDFRFYTYSKEKTWEVLIALLQSSGYIFQTTDKEKGIIKTQPVYFNPTERSTVTTIPSNLMKKDSAQLNVNEHIDLIAHTPLEKQVSWLTSKESLTIQVIPFSHTLTKVQVKFTIEACSDSEGWEVLISNKFTERNILNAIEKQLIAK